MTLDCASINRFMRAEPDQYFCHTIGEANKRSGLTALDPHWTLDDTRRAYRPMFR